METERPELEPFERYFRTAFRLLEGEEDLSEQLALLREYLERHADELPDPKLRDFLVELFFARCRRDLPDHRGSGGTFNRE